MEENIYIEFGKRLAELRTSKELSQNDIAKKLGIAQTTYSGYENGIRKIPLEVISALAELLNVSPTFLILGKTLENKDSASIDLTTKENLLINNYQLLNADGQQKVEDYVDDLVQSGKYKNKAIPPETPPTTLQEALERHFEKEQYRGGVAAFGGQSMSVELTKEQNEQLKELAKKYKDKP